jgi:hypothetical protein
MAGLPYSSNGQHARAGGAIVLHSTRDCWRRGRDCFRTGKNRITNSEGRFVFDGLAPGVFELMVGHTVNQLPSHFFILPPASTRFAGIRLR